MNYRILSLSVGFLLSLIAPASATSKAVVIVPFADLRSDQSLPDPAKSDDKQQTQLLFGETVDVVASSGDWVQVNALDQPEFTTNQRWEGYPGWVQKSAVREIADVRFDGYVSEKWLTVNSTLNDSTLAMLPLGSRIRVFPAEKNPNPGTWINLFNGQVGWIRSGALRPLRACSSDCRSRVLETASLLLGDAYTWGGLTPGGLTDSLRLTGVDCSGLVHLAYRVNGRVVPRDSMDQYLKAKKIHRKDLQPADLVFSAKADNPEKVTHVALYAGNEEILEAPQTGMVVRKVSFLDKYGKPLSQVESGNTVGDRVIYFGRLMKN